MKRIRRSIDPSWDIFELHVTVPFYATDAMGVVWHGDYVRFLEDARSAYFAARETPYNLMLDQGWAAPIVGLQLEYLRSAVFGDVLTVRVACKPNDKCLIELVYEIDNQKQELLCLAETSQAIIQKNGDLLYTRPPPVAAFFAAVAAHQRQKNSGLTANDSQTQTQDTP